MGREVRMVPATWQHPRDRRRRYVPLLGRSYAEEIAAWRKAHDLFAEGKDDTGRPLPESAKGCSFEDWHGSEPRERDYMPDWPAEARTHFQMYENTSEGTPISPVFATPEDLARWLADTRASAFADMTATYDQWLATIRQSSAVSAMIVPQAGLISGVEAGV